MQTPDPPASTNATSTAHAMPQVPGYRVERVLGRGGMAVVYLAVQESLDRQVAIKVMMPGGGLDEAQALRFELEARTIAKLEHPGIVGIHEVGRTGDGQLYYVMPYLANGDLSERDYRDDEDGLIALLRTLLDALGYAHARGIVHRDVKAENVLFNNADQPQLADFGIALSQKGSASPRVTTDGLALGSGGHMPPEQARGAVVDGRADLYSLGVLTYELLTGELPYHADDPLGLAVMHASDPIPRLPGDKAHWQDFIDQAMAKSPERRFRNAQAMTRALDRVHERLHPRGGIVGWLVHPAWRRPGVQVALGALVAVCFAVALWPRGDASAPEPTIAAPTVPAPTPPTLDPEARAAIESRLADAQAQLVAGALLVPAGANAAESYLDVLKADPANSDARTGLESVLAALAATVVDAAQSDGPEATQERYRQTALFADMAQLRTSSAFSTLRVSTLDAALAATQARIAAYDATGANAWWPLLEELAPDPAMLASLRERIAALPSAGGLLRDGDGPELSFIPADGSAPAFAMMRDEVSRADYARFADATNRAAVRCRNRLSPLQLFDKRDWRDPDFKQAPNEPAVCISLDDALAYAQWLSRSTGQRYRLPTTGEWRRAAAGSAAVGCASGNVFDRTAANRGDRHACSDGHANTAPARRFPANTLGLFDLLGNVSEWTMNCGSADNAIARTLEADACPRRAAIGPSWRDGPGVTATSVQMLPPERGYDDVGFRLLREL